LAPGAQLLLRRILNALDRRQRKPGHDQRFTSRGMLKSVIVDN
jgi:hypothetical protein